MSSVTITFVRHAQATHNMDATVRGNVAYRDPIHMDAALTRQGTLSAWLNGIPGPWNTIYCSPLQRCRQTLLGMYPAAETLPVRLDDRLMEPQGVAVCNRRIELPLLREAVPAAWNLDGVAELNPYFVLSEGGTISEMKTATFEQRICDFTNMLLREHAGQHVLVVSHHDWIRVWFRLFKEEHVSLENCETRTVTV